MDTVVRRLEFLKLEGLGFSQVEVVNELSQKLSCTKRVVYKDFDTREIWQPVLKNVVKPDGILLKVLNWYVDALKGIIRAMGMNPEQTLDRDALSDGAITHKNAIDFKIHQLQILSNQLKQIIRQEATV